MRHFEFFERCLPSDHLRPVGIRDVWLCLMFCLLITGCQTPASSFDSSPGTAIPVRIGPDSAQGQRCVAQCQADQWRCETRQQDQLRLCQGEARLALRACEADAYDRLRNCYDRLRAIHGDAWRDHQGHCQMLANNRCYQPACHQPSSCDVPFDSCFERCGGTITEQPVS